MPREPVDWPFFSARELQCKCARPDCERHFMDPEFMQRLVALRRVFGQAMILNSAYRCGPYNAERSSTGIDGPHVTGCAVDVRLHGSEAVYRLRRLAIEFGFSGIGARQHGPVAGRFVHLDTLSRDPNPRTHKGYPRPGEWTYG